MFKMVTPLKFDKEERITLERIKKDISKELNDDFWTDPIIYRILKENEMNAKSTLKTIKGLIEFRKKKVVEIQIEEEEKKTIQNQKIIYLQGKDASEYKRPVIFLDLTKGLTLLKTIEAKRKALYYSFEKYIRKSRTREVILIVNAKNLSLRFFPDLRSFRDDFMEICQCYQSNFYKVLIIDCSRIIRSTWKFMKPIIPKQIYQKYLFCRDHEELKSFINQETK